MTVQSGATPLCSETLPAGSGDSAGYSCSPTNGSVLAASATAYPSRHIRPGDDLVVEH